MSRPRSLLLNSTPKNSSSAVIPMNHKPAKLPKIWAARTQTSIIRNDQHSFLIISLRLYAKKDISFLKLNWIVNFKKKITNLSSKLKYNKILLFRKCWWYIYSCNNLLTNRPRSYNLDWKSCHWCKLISFSLVNLLLSIRSSNQSDCLVIPSFNCQNTRLVSMALITRIG